MPRTKEDHRAARALISAPYPLASITARSPPPPEPPVAPPGRIQGQDNEPGDTLHEAPAATYHGFQVFNPLWRDVEPAFPPVPYPPNDREKRRKWAVRLKKPVKAGLIDTGASEVELMSGIEEGVSREEVQAQQGLMSQHGGMDGVGSWDAVSRSGNEDVDIGYCMTDASVCTWLPERQCDQPGDADYLAGYVPLASIGTIVRSSILVTFSRALNPPHSSATNYINTYDAYAEYN